MPTTRKLEVVTESTPRPARKRPKTIMQALEGSERELLVAMRAKAASTIAGDAPAHTLAGLMKQLRELDKEIRAIDARDGEDGSGTDEEPEDEPLDPSAL